MFQKRHLAMFVTLACYMVHIFGVALASVTITKVEGSGTIVQKDGRKELRVTSGEKIVLTCTISREATGWGLWSGQGTGISYNEDILRGAAGKYSIDKRDNNNPDYVDYILGITNFTLEDEGRYDCMNSGDTDSVFIIVPTQPNIHTITDFQKAREGDTVRMECRANGSPAPTIRWRHVRPNERLPNGIDGRYKHGINLDITSITANDRGEYECLASNGVPDNDTVVAKSTYIQMEYPPDVEAVNAISTTDGDVVNAAVGEEVSLVCKCMSHPRPSDDDIMWYFETNETSCPTFDSYIQTVVYHLPNEESDPYNETTYSILRVSDVNNGSAGRYECEFTNKLDSGYSNITLNIITRPPSVPTEESPDPLCCDANSLDKFTVTIATTMLAILFVSILNVQS